MGTPCTALSAHGRDACASALTHPQHAHVSAWSTHRMIHLDLNDQACPRGNVPRCRARPARKVSAHLYRTHDAKHPQLSGLLLIYVSPSVPSHQRRIRTSADLHLTTLQAVPRSPAPPLCSRLTLLACVLAWTQPATCLGLPDVTTIWTGHVPPVNGSLTPSLSAVIQPSTAAPFAAAAYSLLPLAELSGQPGEGWSPVEGSRLSHAGRRLTGAHPPAAACSLRSVHPHGCAQGVPRRLTPVHPPPSLRSCAYD